MRKPVGNIFTDGSGEQNIVLQHDRQRLAILAHAEVAHWYTVNVDIAGLRLVKADDQIENRRFT
ncbi:hypothetical protein D3C74_391910 [compost metagenome]